MTEYKNLSGQVFGKLTVLNKTKKVKKTYGTFRHWLCMCECGNTIWVRAAHLTSNHTKSCGCGILEKKYKTRKDVCLSYSRVYRCWSSMKQRCFNKKDSNYRNYGGRGISICDEWKNDFMSFYNWATKNGYSDKLTIDRIDNNGNYEPKNCRWTDMKTQSNNTRKTNIIEYNGEKHSISEWGEITGFGYHTIANRFYKTNMSNEEILTKPKIYKNRHISLTTK